MAAAQARLYQIWRTYPRGMDNAPATIVMPVFRLKQKRFTTRRWPTGKVITPLPRGWVDWWFELIRTNPALLDLQTDEDRQQVIKASISFIENAAGGPTQGYNGAGRLKLNGAGYLGETVIGTAQDDGWTKIETLDVNDAPPSGMSHGSAPELIHRVSYQRFWQTSGPPVQLGPARDFVLAPLVFDHSEGDAYLPSSVLRLALRPGEIRVMAPAGLNVRLGPDLSYQKVSALGQGEIVTVRSTAYVDGRVWTEIGGNHWICSNDHGRVLAQ